MLIAAFILVILGILIKNGKMYFLIAGYNTLSAKQKENYDIQNIAVLMRNVLFVIAGVLFVQFFIPKWIGESKWIDWAAISIIIFCVIFLLKSVNSEKYKRKK